MQPCRGPGAGRTGTEMLTEMLGWRTDRRDLSVSVKKITDIICTDVRFNPPPETVPHLLLDVPFGPSGASLGRPSPVFVVIVTTHKAGVPGGLVGYPRAY